ncbi:glycosyltransferase [Aeromonas veronii]|uniref:glycosyltransferase n=1 Tax=Aeromonas veronii TaxID=654 RepID=UPI00187F7D38|nr:glycosyltransferase [Aeromonas veronii]MBE8735440.1 glycosyltransferase family 1 protein [Aeromonas veronii]MBE8740102.1 glycosyltransferase family 1 protein [Aeromonas veronii]MBE8742864.1 glycosyltransferase family 1 protein [Aeromonas veronii]MBE8762791.1 glycosyltransferase family 1 protein [Aeromonas veronii]MBE8838413.1 glycosyltransferase family 1 protein [Aeromonas veronii]
MEHYELVFVTHLPAFYKINLYNELAKKKKILVLFISDASAIRNKDFTSATINFKYEIINVGEFEKRNIVTSCLKLATVLLSLSIDKLVVGGWDLPEFWLSIFFHRRAGNAVVVESTIYESKIGFLKKIIKQIFLARISTAYCSGSPHHELLKALDFKGDVHLTKGVGIINITDSDCEKIRTKPRNNKIPVNFLYVGRLAPEKGLFFAIEYFKKHPQLNLTIVGDGPLRDQLENISPHNVTLVGSVNNKDLADIYKSHDVFLLPSHSETWGLVVEEALYFGLPIICSSYVGCNIELIENPCTGIIYSDSSISSLSNAIDEMTSKYSFFLDNVANFSVGEKDLAQVNIYLS